VSLVVSRGDRFQRAAPSQTLETRQTKVLSLQQSLSRVTVHHRTHRTESLATRLLILFPEIFILFSNMLILLPEGSILFPEIFILFSKNYTFSPASSPE
jgi:hypothetical protein